MENRLPRHVAFIMDGNGRWAAAKGLPRALGHQAGAETVRRVASFARRRGIPYLTLYAFSTENWSRPAEEVAALMRLFAAFLEAELPAMRENGIRFRALGDRAALPAAVRERLDRAEAETAGQSGLTLSLAMNYGGRNEIVRAARLALERLARDGRGAASLDEGFFASCLDSSGLPDPDLVIRTAGEMRLSNFLIWQSAYAELFFSDRHWPDFSDEDFESALAAYGKRTRRFGS
ncbi:MAG: di-trans,poly-cis-decaprenylcistransferase [Planctomycetota bacterium]|jgi:undecaprenyl diphosphate synthase|nr:di-trans,poly-cis-decaprenylcistransferase [Planctomycetota bacterium]